jgi:hypothetical protein
MLFAMVFNLRFDVMHTFLFHNWLFLTFLCMYGVVNAKVMVHFVSRTNFQVGISESWQFHV